MSEIEREKSASQEGDRTEEPSSDPAGGLPRGQTLLASTKMRRRPEVLARIIMLVIVVVQWW